MGGPDGKIFGPRSGRTDRGQRGPCAMTEGQIFSRPARPNSVNKHFIIWPPRRFFSSTFIECFGFLKRTNLILSRAVQPAQPSKNYKLRIPFFLVQATFWRPGTLKTINYTQIKSALLLLNIWKMLRLILSLRWCVKLFS